MTKRLIITAHPTNNGFAHRIASAFIEGSKSANCETELVDLYATEYAQNFLRMYEERVFQDDPIRKKMQEKIIWAEELIFIFPVWWGSCPAIMKNWIDTNFEAGFAYRFQEGGKVEKLLSGKTVQVYCTCDAPAFVYRFPVSLFTINITNWVKFISKFCGMKVKRVEIFGQMRKQNETARQKMLKKVKDHARY